MLHTEAVSHPVLPILLLHPAAMSDLIEPKRPQCAYFLWLNTEGREEAQRQAGSKDLQADLGKVTKIAADKWKTLAAATKSKYEKQAKDLKAKYEKDMEAFKNVGGVKGAARQEKKDAKANKDAKRQKKEDEKDKPKKHGRYLWVLARSKAL